MQPLDYLTHHVIHIRLCIHVRTFNFLTMECAHMKLRLVRIVGSVMCVMKHACMYVGTHARTHTHIMLVRAAPYSALRSSSNW